MFVSLFLLSDQVHDQVWIVFAVDQDSEDEHCHGESSSLPFFCPWDSHSHLFSQRPECRGMTCPHEPVTGQDSLPFFGAVEPVPFRRPVVVVFVAY